MHSMTGFGRGSATADQCAATVEIACVNRKQAEVVVQGVRDLGDLEVHIRKTLLARISRGRMQVTVQIKPAEGAAPAIHPDLPLAEALETAFERISKRIGRKVSPEALDFIRAPGIVNFDDSSLDSDAAWQAIKPALEAALEQTLKMRAAEGDDLARDLTERMTKLDGLRRHIAEIAPERVSNYRESLLKRLRESGLELDLSDERVLREIAVFAERCDISEELTRLVSHFGRFHEYMTGSEPAGRPLDFLCQEIHREFNTIGSKASDADIAQSVVSAKTELEKVREQVQNLE